MSSIYRDLDQFTHEIGIQKLIGEPKSSAPKQREKRKTAEAASKAKMDARKRLVPIQDPDAGKAGQRRKAAMKKGSGRGSTILSQNREKLG